MNNSQDEIVSADDSGDINETVKKPLFDAEVLVCEDNGVNLEVICEHLVRLGIKTVAAENGELGLNKVKERLENNKKQFDLIFMDIHMPVMDGIEAANKIRELTDKIPIVALTANVMANDLYAYKKSGMEDCLGKPFSSNDLWQILLKYIKPVSSSHIAVESEKKEEDELLGKLKLSFVKNNKSRYAEFKEAFDNGDEKLAHRIIHTLKGNAGQIGKPKLRKAAEDVEHYLKTGELEIPADKMNILKYELEAVITELHPLLAEEKKHEITVPLSNEQKIMVFSKLKILLNDGNAECIGLLNDLRNIHGTEELVQLIEHYEFRRAGETLALIISSMNEEK